MRTQGMATDDLVTQLPGKLHLKVERLAKKRGVTLAAVVEEAVRELGRYEPEKMSREELKRYVSEWFKRTAQKTNAGMSPEARQTRARAGALARHAKKAKQQ